jgi:hypothetical protein
VIILLQVYILVYIQELVENSLPMILAKQIVAALFLLLLPEIIHGK